MILDSSPLIAILASEPDAEFYIQAISSASRCRISAGNFIESQSCLRVNFLPMSGSSVVGNRPPSLTAGIYFRLLMTGYFEGLPLLETGGRVTLRIT